MASAKFDEFSNEGKTLVIQFSVKHEQKIDCGGGYVKVYPSNTDQNALTGDSPYHIMFGKKTLVEFFIIAFVLSFVQVLIFAVSVRRRFMSFSPTKERTY